LTCNQRKSACIPAQSGYKLHLAGQCMLSKSNALLSLGQMVIVVNNCSSFTPNDMASKGPSPAFKVVKGPSIAGAKQETTETVHMCQNPNQHPCCNWLVDEPNDQICCTNTWCQSPGDSVLFQHSKNHTNKVQHILSILKAQAFSSFYLRVAHNLACLQPLLDTEQYFFLDHACVVRI